MRNLAFRFHQMNGFRRLLRSMLVVPGFFAALAQTPTPPVVNENVPTASDDYALAPDSRPRSGFPAGKTFEFQMTNSKLFPETTRTITVYIPAAYKADKPACVYVGLDGLGFNAPIVFDNLIAQHAMPVTIGIGVSPGIVSSAQAPANPRFNRSFEFDSLNDRLARFLLDEVFPEVKKHSTPDGQPILLSADRNDRAIGGASTGAIGAFTVAWERPNEFSRVFSAIGTYVGMRGGQSYYVLVRKTEPKPLRVFMQDGVHDEWGGGPEMGDWWMSNQTMERALEFAGYDVRHAWGVGTHNDRQAAMLFPEAMRWLWREWPAPIRSGTPGNPVLKEVLQPGEEWRVVADGCPAAAGLAANARGEVFLQDGGIQNLSRISSSGQPIRCSATGAHGALAFGADGKRYTSQASGSEASNSESSSSKSERSAGIAVSQASGPDVIVANNLRVRGFTVRNNGDIYATAAGSDGRGELWLIRPDGSRSRLDDRLKGPSGVAVSPDGLWLFVAQNLSRSGVGYRLRRDGALDAREPFYDFYVPTWSNDSGAQSIAMDRDGRAYVATRMGVQVFDRNGRVTAILPLPNNGQATSVCFGGDGFHTLYAAAAGRVYRRKLRVAGAPPWGTPIPLPAWGAG